MTNLSDFSARVEALAQKLDGLSDSVDRRFEQVDRRFEQVDQRFEQVDQRFETVLREIAAEGHRTRLHFDLVAEQMKSERNLALDKCLANDQQLTRLAASNAAEHHVFERRLTTLERDRSK